MSIKQEVFSIPMIEIHEVVAAVFDHGDEHDVAGFFV